MSLREETQVERVVDGFHDGLLLVELARVLNTKRAFCGMSRIDYVSGGVTTIIAPPTTNAGEPKDDQLVGSATRCAAYGFRTLIYFLLDGCRQAHMGIKTVGGARYVWVVEGTSTPLPAPASWTAFFETHKSPLFYYRVGAKEPHTWKSAVDACRDMLNALVELAAFTTHLSTVAAQTVYGAHASLSVEDHDALFYYAYGGWAITPAGGHRHLPSGVSWGPLKMLGTWVTADWHFDGRSYTSIRALSIMPMDKVLPPYDLWFLAAPDTTVAHYSVRHEELRCMLTSAPTLSDGAQYHACKVIGRNQETYLVPLSSIGAVPDDLVPTLSTEASGPGGTQISLSFLEGPYHPTPRVYRVRRGSGAWTPYLVDGGHPRLKVSGAPRSVGSVIFSASTPGSYNVRFTLTRVEYGSPPSATARLTVGGGSAVLSSAGSASVVVSLAASEAGTAHAFELSFDEWDTIAADNAELVYEGQTELATEAHDVVAGEWREYGGGDPAEGVFVQDVNGDRIGRADLFESGSRGWAFNKIARFGAQHSEVYSIYEPASGTYKDITRLERDLYWDHTDFAPEKLTTETYRMQWKSAGIILVTMTMELA